MPTLYEWWLLPAVQTPVTVANLACSIYGLYLTRQLSFNGQSLPRLLKVLAMSCVISSLFRGRIKCHIDTLLTFFFTVVTIFIMLSIPESEKQRLAMLAVVAIRGFLVTFATYYATAIAAFMAKLCCSTSIEASAHATPYASLILIGSVPGITRFFELIVTLMNTSADSYLSFFLTSFSGVDQNSAAQSAIVAIDALLILYLTILLCSLLFYSYFLWKKKMDPLTPYRQHLKWRLASSMTIFFFLIAFVFSMRYAAIEVVKFLETASNGPEVRFWVAVVQFSLCFAPRDSVGLLMCLAYIHCRSVYFASLEQARSPRVVIVSSKDCLQVPSKLMDSSKDAISSIPSRPPPLNRDLEARNFLNLSLQSTLGSEDYVRPPSAMQSRSTFHPESFAAFEEDDPGTESQMEAMFGRMEEMPRFDSCHLDDLF